MRLQGEEHQGLPAATVSWERRGQILLPLPGGSHPSGTLASDFWLPELGENELMEFHPPVHGTLSRPPWQTVHWVNTLEWPSEPRVIDCRPGMFQRDIGRAPVPTLKTSEAPMVGPGKALERASHTRGGLGWPGKQDRDQLSLVQDTAPFLKGWHKAGGQGSASPRPGLVSVWPRVQIPTSEHST